MNTLPPKKEHDNEADRPKGDESLPVVHAIKKGEIAHDNKADAEHKHKATLPDKIIAACTILIVAITLCYTYFAREQVGQMKSAVETAANQTAQMVYSVGIAQDQLGEMRRSVKGAAAQARLEQRAWITVNKIKYVCKKGQPVKIEVIFQNTGETPAVQVTSFPRGQIMRPEELPDFRYEGIEKTHSGVIGPNQFFSEKLSFLENIGEQQRNTTIDAILDGEAILGVHGIVDFNDVFGKPHWYEYCYVLDLKSKSFNTCAEHNDIDSDTGNN